LKEFDEIQEMFDKEFRRVNTFEDFRSELIERKEKRAGEELIQENKEEVAIEAIPLAIKFLGIVDIYKERKKSYYQIIRVDGKSQMYMFFSQMLKRFDREDLQDLYKLKLDDFDEEYQVYGRIVEIKSLLEVVGIIAAHIRVNTAQLELVLLVNFTEKYSKCLLLLVEVKTAGIKVNAASTS
nr:hypothetical protein [Tanacetum cinerariifolium]